MNRIAGYLGASSRLACGEDRVGIVTLDSAMFELPGVGEDGMSRRNEQKARNHSWVAEAGRHS